MRVLSWLLVAVFSASSHAAPVVSGKLDPKITRALVTGIIGVSRRVPTPGRASVLIELAQNATPVDLEALTATGTTLVQVKGRTLFRHRFVPAEITTASLPRVLALSSVVRVSLASDRGPLPLDRSAELIRLADARGARPDLGGLTGKGILIADIDSMVDPFHPTFFKGDGGYVDWIDVDHDGVLTPGVDAIDLDGNGMVDAGEIARSLVAQTLDDRDKPVMTRTTFDPGVDWLYLDSNGNGKRDYGKAAGFDDSVLALGEPLFVPDDVNKNGKVDVGERLVRLGTSKFRKIFVQMRKSQTGPILNDEFDRGDNLSETKVDYSGGMLYGFPDALHATGVATILVGDVPLVGRRWVGIAPEAELVVAFDTSDSYPVAGLSWALDESPQVALFELAPWTGSALDGSDPLSTMIDDSAKTDNVTHTCPTGDQGSARKHGYAKLISGTNGTLTVNIPAHALLRQKALTYVQLSINIRGGTSPQLSLTGPKGDVYALTNQANGLFPSGAQYYVTTETSKRGTQFIDVILYSPMDTAPIDIGNWVLGVTGDPGHDITIDAYVSDDQSSWALGAAWDPAVSTDRSTIGIPSVADHCIAVNASADHLVTPTEPWYAVGYSVYDVPPGYADHDGQIRAYTPRGPRIDGVTKPDVTAPDNPWVATEHVPGSTMPYGSFRVFGGTSGASPHVTGVAALLAQTGVQGDAARTAIRNGAVHDNVTGPVPNGDYGYGRLDAAGALGVTAVGKDFTVTLTVDPAKPTVADKPKLIAVAVGDADAVTGLEARWDDGYDGTWDTEFAALAPHAIAPPVVASTQPYKVRVRNAAGHVAEAVLWVTFAKAPPGCGCTVGGAAPSPGVLLYVLAGMFIVRLLRRRRV